MLVCWISPTTNNQQQITNNFFMTSLSSKVKSKFILKRFLISQHQREQIARWLVELIPNAFDQVFQFLTNNQLLLLIVCGLFLLTPLITAKPAIWQQGLVAALLLLVGRITLQIEEQCNSKKKQRVHSLIFGFTEYCYNTPLSLLPHQLYSEFRRLA